MRVAERDEPAVFQIEDDEEGRHVPVSEELEPFSGKAIIHSADYQDGCDDYNVQNKYVPSLSKPHEYQDKDIKQHNHAYGEFFL
jgi:hypothetical protein